MAPLALQRVAESSFVYRGKLEQVPKDPARLHALQIAVQPLLQQTPSTQNPDTQSVPLVQAAPLEHLPEPLQVYAPVQVFPSVWPFGTLEQVPSWAATSHLTHMPVQAVLQQ